MSIDETKPEAIKKGDPVVLKSGSPHMIIVKVPSNPEGLARCIFWNSARSQFITDDYPMTALESIADHTRRLQKYQEMALAGSRPVIRPDEKTVVIQFESVEDMEAYLDKYWTDQKPFKGTLN